MKSFKTLLSLSLLLSVPAVFAMDGELSPSELNRQMASQPVAPVAPEAPVVPEEGFWTRSWTGIKNAPSSALNGIKSAPGSAWTGIKSAPSYAWTGVKNAPSYAWTGVKNAPTWVNENKLKTAGIAAGLGLTGLGVAAYKYGFFGKAWGRIRGESEESQDDTSREDSQNDGDVFTEAWNNGHKLVEGHSVKDVQYNKIAAKYKRVAATGDTNAIRDINREFCAFMTKQS